MSWNEPVRTGQNGQAVGYNLTCNSKSLGGNATKNIVSGLTDILNSTDTVFTINDVAPHSYYTCNLSFINTVGQGPPTKCSFTTAQDSKSQIEYALIDYFIVPTAPINFTSNPTKTNITFRWRRPDSPNGVIIQYNLTVLNLNMPNTTISIIHVQDSNQENLQKVISGFGPYQSYNASITASTIIGAGPPATTTGRTEPDSK